MPSVRVHPRKYRPPRFRKKTCPICGRQISFAFGNYQRHYKKCLEKAKAKKEALEKEK